MAGLEFLERQQVSVAAPEVGEPMTSEDEARFRHLVGDLLSTMPDRLELDLAAQPRNKDGGQEDNDHKSKVG